MNFNEILTKEISINQIVEACKNDPMSIVFGYLIASTIFGFFKVRKGNTKQKSAWTMDDFIISVVSIVASALWVPFYLVSNVTVRSRMITTLLGLDPEKRSAEK